MLINCLSSSGKNAMSEQVDTHGNRSFIFGEIYAISLLINKRKPFQFYFGHKIEDDFLCASSVPVLSMKGQDIS